MENARIIKLDSPLTVYANNFDDVFGEYSNVSSKRKDRIVKRNADKKEIIAARGEKKVLKKQTKAATKVAKQAGKGSVKAARAGKRQEAQQARIAKRTAATAARQQKRTIRKVARVERAALGQEADALATENGSAQPQDVSQDETQGAADETIANSQPEEQEGAPMNETETTEDSDIEAGEEEAAEEEGAEDEGTEDEGSEGDGEYEDEYASADGINYENLGDVNDIYALNSDDFYTYESGSANPDGSVGPVRAKIDADIKDIAIKSEWNKEMVLQKQNQVAAINNQLANGGLNSDQAMQLGKVRAQILSDIELHKDRAVSFDGVLSDYCNAEGEFSNANGKNEKKRRKAEVKAAKREAKKVRKKSIISRMKRKNRVTKVSRNLKPEFDTQRIVIPAAELTTGANGETGLIALDNMNDFDAPTENEFEFSNASGPMKNVNWKGVLMGVAVAGLAIWGAKKAKLF
jgi:hypothetical protein